MTCKNWNNLYDWLTIWDTGVYTLPGSCFFTPYLKFDFSPFLNRILLSFLAPYFPLLYHNYPFFASFQLSPLFLPSFNSLTGWPLFCCFLGWIFSSNQVLAYIAKEIVSLNLNSLFLNTFHPPSYLFLSCKLICDDGEYLADKLGGPGEIN